MRKKKVILILGSVVALGILSVFAYLSYSHYGATAKNTLRKAL